MDSATPSSTPDIVVAGASFAIEYEFPGATPTLARPEALHCFISKRYAPATSAGSRRAPLASGPAWRCLDHCGYAPRPADLPR